MACTNPNTFIRCCCLLSPLVVLFVVLAFATDYWVEEEVDWSKLQDLDKVLANSNPDYARFSHTRHRGLLKECYPQAISDTFIKNADNVVDDECFYLDFSNPKGVAISFEYQRRMDFMRASLALYVFGLVGIIIVLFMSFLMCCVRHVTVAHIASIVSIASGLLVLTSIILFHATEYVEGNNDGDFGELAFQNTWTKRLRLATDSGLGYSYACAWLGFILAVINGVLFMFMARTLRRYIEKYGSTTSETDSTYSSDKEVVVKQMPFAATRKPDVYMYDNPGMMMPVGYPMGMDQALPVHPAMDYGNAFYQLSDSSVH